MGSVALEGFGSGGAGLNFKVVFNPQPSDPKENTIWVETDVPITSYIFSATEPEAPTDGKDGMVWISTGTSSTVEFNALKKNGIQVYPLSAKQYVGGAWVDKTAKSWQGGEWVDWWNGELYKAGNEYEFITGGWIASTWKVDNLSSVTPTVTRSEDSIVVAVSTPSSSGTCGTLRTTNKIDLSVAKRLHFEFDINIPDGAIKFFVASGATSDVVNVVAMGSIGNTTATKYDLDVSAINDGSYYIGVQVSAFNYNTKKLTMYECKLEA